MREFTAEMLHTLTEANNSVNGTTEYSKYHMETTCKGRNGRWFFVGHCIPTTTGTIKTQKEATYIFTDGDNRYLVSDKVKRLLGI